MKRLKAELAKRLGGNAQTLWSAHLYRAKDDAGRPIVAVSTDHLDDFAARVVLALEPMIRHQIDDYWNRKPEFATRVLDVEVLEQRRLGAGVAGADSFVGWGREPRRIAA